MLVVASSGKVGERTEGKEEAGEREEREEELGWKPSRSSLLPASSLSVFSFSEDV